MLDLYIGNKNYSSWSLRVWLVAKVFEIPFQEHWIAFDDFKACSPFKQKISEVHAAAKVPVLTDGEVSIGDSFAICEYLAELYPEKQLWPENRVARARARSISAEMHSGFMGIRSACPMNIEADLSVVGRDLCQLDPRLNADLARIQAIWAERPMQDGFVGGAHFSIADAFYAPVILRLVGYGLAIDAVNRAYVQRILGLPALQQWIAEAKQEHCFVAIDEPYRKAPLEE